MGDILTADLEPGRAAASADPSRPRRVLIVEDESIVQLHLSRIASDLGYSVIGPVATGEAALAAAAQQAPDVALLDVRLASSLDGIETAQALRAQHRCAVVFVTAYTDDKTIARIEAVQASGFVAKPFRHAEVRVALAAAVRERAAAAATPPAARPRQPRQNARVLLYSHDTLGLGHLQRSLNLAHSLLARDRRMSVLLTTGSPVAHRFPLPPGSDSVKLPAVRKVAADDYAARSLDLSGDEILRMRTNLLLRTVRDFEPDVVIVDHAPAGMRGEMLPALRWLAENSSCVRVLGLRDIIDDPESVCAAWTRDGVYDTVSTLYDQVNVYGMRDVFDVTAAYRFPAAVADKTRFVGYVTRGVDSEDDAPPETRSSRPRVLVTIGGGDGGLDDVIGNYLAMLQRYRPHIDFDSIILTGPLVPAAVAQQLATQAAGLPVVVHDFVPSARAYMRRADLVVCTGGYNTMAEVLSLAARAIVIPRILHRQEQRLRAECFASLGLVEVLSAEDVSPELLYTRVDHHLKSAMRPLAAARARRRLDFDGAERVADWCSDRVRRVLRAGGSI